MLTGELAALAGVPASTVRYYERRGLLPDPGRTNSGYRAYPASALETLAFIKRASDLGFSLRETKELLDARDEPDACGEMCSLAEHKVKELAAAARNAVKAQRVLADLLSKRKPRSRSARSCPVGRHLEGNDDSPRNRR
jgi:DNA-binding transcriptional MerR regulator